MEEKELTGQIIRNFYTVYNTLGYGFLESVYQNAMMLELVGSGLRVEPERGIAVSYNGRVVGTFAADLVVEDRVIIELKAKERLINADEAQLTNYLRATEIEIGLLFNFGRSPEFKRKYFSNANKKLTADQSDEVLLKALFVDDPF
ncbi:MAG: GxxExxY protein [Pyrinomonadaceae bacterium]|nr:GxxExxY protein [Pyrinomonadaceae bacterium]